MKKLEIHPAALAFPPMTGDDLKGLVESIRQHGQLHPVVLLDGKVIDGRNRVEACRIVGVEVKTTNWSSRGVSPARFAEISNDKRRHLTESQRAMVATRLLTFFKKEAKERQRDAARATNRKKKQPELTLPRTGRKAINAAKEASKASGVGARTIERAAYVQKKSPTLAKKVFDGVLTVKQAEKAIRREEQLDGVKAYVAPAGVFEVIAVDFPWSYDDKLDGMGRALDYPTMSIEEICNFHIPCDTNCALFMWVTNSHLIDPDAFPKVVRALRMRYGFKEKAIRTWVKDRMGMGHYWRNETEHLVLLTRGHPVFNDVTQTSSFRAPMTGASEKPAYAYDDIEAMCAGASRLELFARKPRDGWVTSGSELTAPTVRDDAAGPGADGPQIPSPEGAVSQTAASGTPGLTLHSVAYSKQKIFDDDDVHVPPPTPESLEPVRPEDLPF